MRRALDIVCGPAAASDCGVRSATRVGDDVKVRRRGGELVAATPTHLYTALLRYKEQKNEGTHFELIDHSVK